jgi:hypothetical protein
MREHWHFNFAPQRASSDRPLLAPPLGAHFTCFTGTKVQTLTQKRCVGAAATLLSTIYTEPEREAVLSTFHRIYAGLEDTDGLVGTK